MEHEDDDVEEVYMQTFQISYKDPFGSVVYHDLLPDGDKIPVTLYNKQVLSELFYFANFIISVLQQTLLSINELSFW